MSNLSALVKEYKENPSEDLKDQIIDFLVNAENPEELDKIHRVSGDEWYSFENMRFRLLYGKCYVVTEVYKLEGGFMCYACKIDLSDYKPSVIHSYEQNCLQYKDAVSQNYFSIYSVASAYDVENAEMKQLVTSEDELRQWFEKVNREVK